MDLKSLFKKKKDEGHDEDIELLKELGIDDDSLLVGEKKQNKSMDYLFNDLTAKLF